MRVPDASQPITVEPHPERLVVRLDGAVVADTTSALTLREAAYPPVWYIPYDDVDGSFLRRSDHHTSCPFKGQASYYHLVVGDKVVENAIWVYEEPYDAVAEIQGHLAFYPQNVTFAQE